MKAEMIRVFEGSVSKEPLPNGITLTKDGRVVSNNQVIPIEDEFYFYDEKTKYLLHASMQKRKIGRVKSRNSVYDRQTNRIYFTINQKEWIAMNLPPQERVTELHLPDQVTPLLDCDLSNLSGEAPIIYYHKIGNEIRLINQLLIKKEPCNDIATQITMAKSLLAQRDPTDHNGHIIYYANGGAITHLITSVKPGTTPEVIPPKRLFVSKIVNDNGTVSIEFRYRLAGEEGVPTDQNLYRRDRFEEFSIYDFRNGKGTGLLTHSEEDLDFGQVRYLDHDGKRTLQFVVFRFASLHNKETTLHHKIISTKVVNRKIDLTDEIERMLRPYNPKYDANGAIFYSVNNREGLVVEDGRVKVILNDEEARSLLLNRKILAFPGNDQRLFNLVIEIQSEKSLQIVRRISKGTTFYLPPNISQILFYDQSTYQSSTVPPVGVIVGTNQLTINPEYLLESLSFTAVQEAPGSGLQKDLQFSLIFQ